MTQEGGPTGPVQDDYWEQKVTMTRAQLQGERDAWYENGLSNGAIGERGYWRLLIELEDKAAAR